MIRVEEAVKRYQRVTAVDGVSFSAQPGEILALLGSNGAGKTSLIRMIMGITLPDAGAVDVRVAGKPAQRNQLGYMPEERGLHRNVPIGRTLDFFGRLQGLLREDARKKARAWLERLDLAERAGDKVEELSRGNQQKVQFVAAILHSPRVAILDEPFAGLDPVNQDLFIELLDELRRAGVCVLLSAHEMSLVERVADRIVLLSRGRVIHRGSLDEIRSELTSGDAYRIEFDRAVDASSVDAGNAVVSVERRGERSLRVLLAPDAPLGQALAALDAASITSIEKERVSLHDAYVRAMNDLEQDDGDRGG